MKRGTSEARTGGARPRFILFPRTRSRGNNFGYHHENFSIIALFIICGLFFGEKIVFFKFFLTFFIKKIFEKKNLFFSIIKMTLWEGWYWPISTLWQGWYWRFFSITKMTLWEGWYWPISTLWEGNNGNYFPANSSIIFQ